MVEELVTFVLEEVIGAAFSGAFRQARSRRARCLKLAAWTCAVSSVTLFIAATKLAKDNLVIPAVVAGAVGTAGFFGFGVWAAIANGKCEHKGKS